MQKVVATSGKYLNIGNAGFRSIRNGEYIDKSGLVGFMNRCLNTPQKLICVSRPRRFGKSFATKMLCAYYSKDCDSRDLFENLKIAQDSTFETNLNLFGYHAFLINAKTGRPISKTNGKRNYSGFRACISTGAESGESDRCVMYHA